MGEPSGRCGISGLPADEAPERILFSDCVVRPGVKGGQSWDHSRVRPAWTAESSRD